MVKQSVKSVVLTGQIQKIEFEKSASKYLIKNFSDGEIYVSFYGEINDDHITIGSKFGQECVINERYKTAINTVYIQGSGTGNVEVQQLWI